MRRHETILLKTTEEKFHFQDAGNVKNVLLLGRCYGSWTSWMLDGRLKQLCVLAVSIIPCVGFRKISPIASKTT